MMALLMRQALGKAHTHEADPSEDQPRFVCDENFNQNIIASLRRRYPTIDVLIFAEAGLVEGVPDPQVVVETARLDRILLTHDRQTMPTHFAAVLAERLPIGEHLPGALIISQSMPFGVVVEEIALDWGASRHGEWRDRGVFLPE